MLICWGCRSKVAGIGWLKQHELIFSQVWSLEVQDQGICVVPSDASFPGLDGCLLPGLLWCVSLCPHFLLEGHQLYWIRAHPSDLILTELLFKKTLSPATYNHIPRCWEVRHQRMNFGGHDSAVRKSSERNICSNIVVLL